MCTFLTDKKLWLVGSLSNTQTELCVPVIELLPTILKCTSLRITFHHIMKCFNYLQCLPSDVKTWNLITRASSYRLTLVWSLGPWSYLLLYCECCVVIWTKVQNWVDKGDVAQYMCTKYSDVDILTQKSVCVGSVCWPASCRKMTGWGSARRKGRKAQVGCSTGPHSASVWDYSLCHCRS